MVLAGARTAQTDELGGGGGEKDASEAVGFHTAIRVTALAGSEQSQDQPFCFADTVAFTGEVSGPFCADPQVGVTSAALSSGGCYQMARYKLVLEDLAEHVPREGRVKSGSAAAAAAAKGR